MTTAQPRMVGARVARLEDPRFLRGEARYIANIALPGMRHARFVRSPLAHARITGVDRSGVPAGVDIFTGEDWGAPAIECTSRYEGFQRAPMPVLATGKVRYAGEPVAMVIADDPYLAEDAAESVAVDYDPLPPVTTVDEALAADATLVHEEWNSNRFVPRAYESPDYEREVEGPLSVSGRFLNSRHSGVPLEGRAVLAEYVGGRIRVHTSTQIPHLVRTGVASAMDLSESSVQIVSPDVGGGFGVKAQTYPEEVACAIAARALGVPVKWVEDRREHFLASHHSREHRHDATLHYDEEGKIKGLTAAVRVDMGAYSVFPWTSTMDTGMAMGILPGPYRFTGYKVDGYPTCTNKTPYGAYRGVARPAACFTIERLVDWMARERGLDRLEARRMNLVKAGDYPWTNPGGLVYDGGSLAESIDVMRDWIGYDSLNEELARDRRRGRLRGLGVAIFTEQSAHTTEEFKKRGVPIVFGYETAMVRLDPTGNMTIAASIHNHGQGLETTLGQLAGERLGLTLDRIDVVFGDTDQVSYGFGTFASRSAVLAGGAARLAAGALREKLARVAAHLLEASEKDLVFRENRVEVVGTPGSSVAIEELCRITYHRPDLLPPGVEPTLEETRVYDAPPGTGTYTNALHAGVVEIDPATGAIDLQNYWVVEDCGVMINPLIVEGQIHGGVAQGVGSALFEEMVYDDEGQLLTTTFMDYLLPTAEDIPFIATRHLETPSPTTEGGLKGMGEGGAIAPAAVIAGGVEDALSGLGRVWVSRVPLTPERVLGHVAEARSRQ